MISLEQIRLLEQKVEDAVSRITQLNAENASLKQRCTQLEQENEDIARKLSAFEQDQEKIEQGIINALDRLNTVENSVLLAAGLFQQEQPLASTQDNTSTEQYVSTENHDEDMSSSSTWVNDNQTNTDQETTENLFSEISEQPQSGTFDIF